MSKEVVGYIPRILFRFYLYLKQKFDNRPPITQEEQYSVDICLRLIKLQSSKLTYAPISHKRFIKNDDLDMFIVIDSNTVNLINHVYSYSVYIENSDLYLSILKSFDEVLEDRRQELENEIRSNIQHSLKNILQKID